MNVYKAAFIATFGRGGNRPFRSALWRLSLLALTAGGAGWLLSKGAQALPFGFSQNYLFVFSAAFAVQATVLFSLLVASGSYLQRDRFAAWLLTMPVGRWQRWFVLMLPQFVLAGLSLLLAGWPLCILLLKLGLAPLLLLPAAVLGVASAFGLTTKLPRMPAVMQILVVPGLLWLEYILLKIINTTSSAVAGGALLAVLILLGALPILNAYYLRSQSTAEKTSKPLRTSGLPVWVWFGKKIMRSPRMRLSFGVSLAMSVAMAILYTRFPGLPPGIPILFAAILAAAFVSDNRSLSRHTNPAEITGLHGTLRFFATQLCAAVPSGLLAVSPLIWIGASAGLSSMMIGSQLLTGIVAGLFAGTVVVPQARDISGQCAATLICLSILVLLPQIFPFRLPGLEIVLIGILGIAAFWVEYRRNSYKWREKHAWYRY